MAPHVEWRTKGEMDDAILLVDDDNTVRQAQQADPEVLRAFLTDLVGLDAGRERQAVEGDQRNPEAWGELIMARATTQEVIRMDPELFWEGMYLWFRSRGIDPHAMRR